MPRRAPKLADMMSDPGFARTVERLLQEQRHALPNEHALNVAAEVKPRDVDRAESLFDEAQRRAGTGLEGLLSARQGERDA
jgi:hypothetical protein